MSRYIRLFLTSILLGILGTAVLTGCSETWVFAKVLTQQDTTATRQETVEVRNCGLEGQKTVECAAGTSSSLTITVGATIGSGGAFSINPSVATELGISRSSGQSIVMPMPPRGGIYRYAIIKTYHVIAGQGVMKGSSTGVERQGDYTFDASCEIQVESRELLSCDNGPPPPDTTTFKKGEPGGEVPTEEIASVAPPEEQPSPIPQQPKTAAPAQPACPGIEGKFQGAWSRVVDQIGCATGPAQQGPMVDENFDSGKMFWREAIDTARAVVLFSNGTWRIFPHSPYADGMPEYPCADGNTPAQTPPTPRRGFGTMWCDTPDIRQGLGNATNDEKGYQGVMQSFDNGFMLTDRGGAIYIFFGPTSGSWSQ